MTIRVKILAHSRTLSGKRLCSMELYYPRMIHAEFLRHRVFSHSVASSRAIPIARMLANIKNDPAEPVKWGSNKPGMQSGAELRGWKLNAARAAWSGARRSAVSYARLMARFGVHKEIVNRITEPWSHTTQIVTSSEWTNFFDLRIHEAAEPTIRALSVSMLKAMVDDENNVVLLKHGDWHLPYISDGERLNFDHVLLARASAARCARVSYLNHDKSDPEIRDDLQLADNLLFLRHLSPFEHQATPGVDHMNGNFCAGWQQFRKMLEVEAGNV